MEAAVARKGRHRLAAVVLSSSDASDIYLFIMTI